MIYEDDRIEALRYLLKEVLDESAWECHDCGKMVSHTRRSCDSDRCETEEALFAAATVLRKHKRPKLADKLELIARQVAPLPKKEKR